MVSSPTLVRLSIYWPDAADPLRDLEITLAASTRSLAPWWILMLLTAVGCQHTFKMTVAMWSNLFLPFLLFFFHHSRLRSLVKLPQRPKCSLVLWWMAYAWHFLNALFVVAFIFQCVWFFKTVVKSEMQQHHPKSYNAKLNIRNLSLSFSATSFTLKTQVSSWRCAVILHLHML